MRKELTDILVRSIAAPPTGRTEVNDIRCAGLSLRITATGARSWSFRFRDPKSGHSARANIGRYPDVALSRAREEADKLRKQVALGSNPVNDKRRVRAEAATMSFAALADRYRAEHARRFKRSADADERNLRLHILPKWKNWRYDEIERKDAIALVEGIISEGKSTLANRVHALISSIFSFAVDADLIKANPVARLRKRGVETIGRRILTDEEIRLFWPKIILPPVSRRVGLALRLVLLTGVRPGEAAGLACAELESIDDNRQARWIIPASRSKNGRAHLVPLSEAARQTVLLARELIAEEDEYLFPSPSVKGAPVTEHALAVAMARFARKLDAKVAKSWRAEPPTPHDLRRTAATRLAELGIPKEDRDAVLNHVPQGVGKKHYDLYEREREKRRALDLWEQALTAVLANVPTDTVVPLTSRRRNARA